MRSVRKTSEAFGHYSMTLEWDPQDQIYVVTVPELPGCQTHGRSLEEAVRQGQDAIATWVVGMRYWGRPIPEPRHFAMEEPDAPT
jgi:predicted RNase H-like HicB family nuclease